MEELLNLFNQIAPITVTLQEDIFHFLKRREIRKKEMILREGQHAQSIYFIEKGLVRSFHYFKSREITNWMMMENDIFVPVQSFFFHEPSVECIEALEDCVLYGITSDQLHHLYLKHPEFNLHRAVILERYYAESEKRHTMRMQPAYDRYLYLLAKQPNLVGRVPDKYLASYLGITKGTLAVQRAKFAHASRKKIA